jgi:hypothetical protein
MEDRKRRRKRGASARGNFDQSKLSPKRPSGNVAMRTPGKPSACESCGWPES